MPRPTKITDHSEKALERLPDKLKGKPLIAALFRSKSSARIDALLLEPSTLYRITVNSVNVDYTSTLFDTKSNIVAQLTIEANNTGALDAKASIITENDEFLYLTPKVTGTELTITVIDNLGWRRIGLVDQIQELEDLLFDILDNRMLDVAEGRQLDRIGEMLNLARAGSQSDDDYRVFLGVKIKQNLSQGEPETLISILAALTESTLVRYSEFYPAAVVLYFDGEIVGTPSNLRNLIDGIAAGGVRVDIVQGDLDEAFVFEGVIGKGYSSTLSPTTGGRYASSKGL